MKKLTLFAVLLSMLCAWPMDGSAQGIEKGDQLVSVFLGGSAPLQESGVRSESITGDSLGNAELDWGDGAASYGVQYMYALTSHFAIGAEYNGNNFGEAEYEREYFFNTANWGEDEIDSKMNVQNFMVAARYTFNPQANTRFYIPLGLGIASSKATFDYNYAEMSGGALDRDSSSTSKTSTSFAYYLGLGMEGQINDNWVWGVEGRYQAFTFDYGKFSNEYGKENLSYFALLFKLGYRF